MSEEEKERQERFLNSNTMTQERWDECMKKGMSLDIPALCEETRQKYNKMVNKENQISKELLEDHQS